jgi:hypothetical protein
MWGGKQLEEVLGISSFLVASSVIFRDERSSRFINYFFMPKHTGKSWRLSGQH